MSVEITDIFDALIFVAVSTSTLAMGVNFPAHLVVVKSTEQYVGGAYKEYSETQMLQMIGRAGRPQAKYENLVNGKQLVESRRRVVFYDDYLPKETMNLALGVLKLDNPTFQVQWSKIQDFSTNHSILPELLTPHTNFFSFITHPPQAHDRASERRGDAGHHNRHLHCHGVAQGLRFSIREFLRTPSIMVRSFSNAQPSYPGMLIHGPSVHGLTSDRRQFRINMDLSKEKIERKLQDMCIKELNGLRKYKLIYMDDDSFYLRPTDTGRLMAKYYLAFETMKSFSLLTGNENLPELPRRNAVPEPHFKLYPEVLADCLSLDTKGFSVLHHATVLAKCFKARLWENSKHVSRQLDKIGVAPIYITGERWHHFILKILNRNPPFGSVLVDSVRHLPGYQVHAEQSFGTKGDGAAIRISVVLENGADLRRRGQPETRTAAPCWDLQLLELGLWSKEAGRAPGGTLYIHWISDSYVENPKDVQQRLCYHKCLDKSSYGHLCCKTGVHQKPPTTKKTQIENFMDQLHDKMNSFPTKSQARCRKERKHAGYFHRRSTQFGRRQK
ncbi:probable ATP-dependent DNA helicase HFM1 [Caerostris extrusa]|uniref:Probable ATP-dependent DNA helicase HFM1 n=1 Tax=Caerostris extrusa TaxID=172846 RepID=A0AAV4V451_CAEEX|nr:probable ATP-dependent DNA helicase HFM1 [Caerostris extrusa]